MGPKMKRKAEQPVEGLKPALKKRPKTALTAEEAQSRFRPGLFEPSILKQYTTTYATSSPYKHSVIHELVSDRLLRSVRDEIKANVSFTPKETDIYKIHQSGDLANLDGLDDGALQKLPSLLALRDALYSETFRHYISTITGCGPLSGRKTDMAINVYTPGCYLLCHDDVIGSRKVSYILYLTDPDAAWQPGWGGALRLYPVTEHHHRAAAAGEHAQNAKTPGPDFAKVIPPAWNQLSFFAVQPGESFHDVEEVYRAGSKAELDADAGRVRMAISGWFHIPQPGEDGYVPGAEEKAAARSGLMQLQGNPDQYDRPEAWPVPVEKEEITEAEAAFGVEDLEFLVKYLAPTYLTPDTLERVADHFDENFSITLPGILHPKFAGRLRAYVEGKERETLPEDSGLIEERGAWKVARPPHKHRFAYLQPGAGEEEDSPIRELLEVLLPSRAFRAWLQLATKSAIESHDFVARRFRRGKDYTLATGHEGKPRLEMNLGFTPTGGWGDVDDDEDEDEEEESEAESEASTIDGSSGKALANGKGKGKGKARPNGKSRETGGRKEPKKRNTNGEKKGEEEEEEEVEVGGHEVYMAGDGDDDEDAAVYKSSNDEDNILFFQAAAWNKMTLVLRDSGTLRFVKYVSRSAKGDRWDISGTFEIEEQDEEPDEDDGVVAEQAVGVLDDTEEEFKGFSDSGESDSD